MNFRVVTHLIFSRLNKRLRSKLIFSFIDFRLSRNFSYYIDKREVTLLILFLKLDSIYFFYFSIVLIAKSEKVKSEINR